MNIKKLFNTDTLVKVGTLGVGSVAAKYVTSNEVAGKLLKTENAMKFAPAIPIVAGSMIAQSRSALAKGLGFGMVAQGAGSVIAGLVDPDGSKGLNGMVMMNGTPFLNSTPDQSEDSTYQAPSFSSNASNEMAY